MQQEYIKNHENFIVKSHKECLIERKSVIPLYGRKMIYICNINVINFENSIKSRKMTSFFGKSNILLKLLQMQLLLFRLYNIILLTKKQGGNGNENH